MKRIQVQLDEATYQTLKHAASDRGISVSAFLRELLREKLSSSRTLRRVEDFRFIGSGSSEQGDAAPVSERHDEALANDFAG